MASSEQFNRRVRALGREIFERADAAQPGIWEKEWWSERVTHFVDQNPVLKMQAFSFVDCLPALRSHEDISRHVQEYLGSEDPSSLHGFVASSLPYRFSKVVRGAVGPGPLQRMRRELVGIGARFGATQMAGRFIAGSDVASALLSIVRLRGQGMAFTIDVLGESTTSYVQADRYADAYHHLIAELTKASRNWRSVPALDEDISGRMPRVNLSIKLTGLDPYFDAIDPERAIRTAGERLRAVLRRAREAGAFVNVDMESTKHRALTLDLFMHVMAEDDFRNWEDVGIAVQAYVTDAERDLARLLEWGKRRGSRFAIRLVKGAYWDAETAAAVRAYKTPPVFTEKWQSDACFERMSRVMLQNRAVIRPAFASHNIRSLAAALASAEELGASPREYEVQMLYGMGDPLKTAMVQLGQCVRVYCPYGELMPGMGYLIRRLLENTSNEGFLKQSFRDRALRERLLSDPADARPPSSPPAARHYRDTEFEESASMFKNASNTNFASEANRNRMKGAISYVRGELERSYPLVIDGRAVTTGETFNTVNPSHPGEIIGCVSMGSTADVDRAVAAARRAFGVWRLRGAIDRAALLRKAADRLELLRFELAATMVLEVGKPWREADAEVTEAIDHCRYYAAQVERIESHPRLRNLPGEDNMLTYSAKGVCAVISPWAFPLAILTGMTSAALAAGNTAVVKPARQASVLAAKLVKVFHDVGVPPGVVNFVPGDGAVVGMHMVEHRDVDIVAFTGSQEVGTAVIRAGARVSPGQAFIRKMIVEMGGKNAIIVDDDADVDGAVQAVIESAFSFAGQKCSSCSRMIVLDGVYDEMTTRLRDAVESLPIGPADEPSTIVGPVIDEVAVIRIRKYLEIGMSEGNLMVQAKLPEACSGGYFVPPTIFTDVGPDARIAQEEIFGPVLAVIRARDFEVALDIANGTRYALTGGVFSRSPVHIDRARRELAVGNLYINRRITGSQVDAQPFGGFKLSGTGVKAGSPDYLLHFMDARCITENTARSGLVPDEQHTEYA